jgi:hypothetical protein
MKKLLVILMILTGQVLACCPGDCCSQVVTNKAINLLKKYDKSYVIDLSNPSTPIGESDAGKKGVEKKKDIK